MAPVSSVFSFEEISQNVYDGKNIMDFNHNEAVPFEAITIKDGQKKCKIHRRSFKNIQLKYRRSSGTYGISAFVCEYCNRIYVERSKVATYIQKLSERKIEQKIYDYELSQAYLNSQTYAEELKEKLYVPNVWIEEHPTCPIHGYSLDDYAYKICYGDRKVEFIGFFCEMCGKVFVRRTAALDIEDKCAEIGVPFPGVEIFRDSIPERPMDLKEVKPDYFIQDGKKQQYNYDYTVDYYRLTEEDIIVISDSVYCGLPEHDTEEVMILFSVEQKKGGRKSFLCLAGFCSQCQKYYLAEEDYKVIYSIGRPEVTVVNDVDGKDYYITSGEVFEFEKNHLKQMEKCFSDKIDGIHKSSDYVPQMATENDYELHIQLQEMKRKSREKYEKTLDDLLSFIPKPYSYRVDITFADKTEVYYLGASDICVDGKQYVISFNSAFGKELVNYRSIHIFKNGARYDIKLSRQFDIENANLYGYANLRTDEDIIFRKGVTDPFLIKVLNLRKKQHNLVDIIATIQENQNKIVDAPFGKGLVVQGCAGSGKTMVLLHRLSFLKYNHPEYDFDQAIILTPNEQFNLHIQGLAESLQIGGIERKSIEQYYIDVLRKYSEEFVPENKLASEIFVRQELVDYVYSDDFLEHFEEAYAIVIASRKKIKKILQYLFAAMDSEYHELIINADCEFVPQVKQMVEHCASMVKESEKEIKGAEESVSLLERRIEELKIKIPKSEEFSKTIVKETIPRIYTKIGTLLSEVQHDIDVQTERIREIKENAEKIKKQVFVFGKGTKLEELKKEHDKVNRKRSTEKKRLEEVTSLFDVTMTEKTDEEIVTWMQKVALYDSSIRDEIRLCQRGKEEFVNLTAERNSISERLERAKEHLKEVKTKAFPEDVQMTIAYLQSVLQDYTDYNTFSEVFALALSDFVEKNKIGTIRGTHRFKLYAELCFCMKYYRRRMGTSKLICVDEGQDLAFNEYRMLFELNHKEVIFNIFGDTNQLLKPGRGIISWEEIVQYFGLELFELNENYRNTNQITRFCNDSFGMNVLQTGSDGAKVREILKRDLEKEISSLKLNDERVAILIPRRVLKKGYIEMEVLPKKIRDVIGAKIGNGFISFLYVDEVKGIEFDKVFVISNKMSKNEKYIAYTRALSELIIVVDNSVTDDDTPAEDAEEMVG